MAKKLQKSEKKTTATKKTRGVLIIAIGPKYCDWGSISFISMLDIEATVGTPNPSSSRIIFKVVLLAVIVSVWVPTVVLGVPLILKSNL